MPTFDDLRDRIAATSDLDAALSVLLDGLAGRIKATSNDQNINGSPATSARQPRHWPQASPRSASSPRSADR